MGFKVPVSRRRLLRPWSVGRLPKGPVLAEGTRGGSLATAAGQAWAPPFSAASYSHRDSSRMIVGVWSTNLMEPLKRTARTGLPMLDALTL
jgi:hypothetical protein